jgi:histone-lysine N-methyltransferase EZH2
MNIRTRRHARVCMGLSTVAGWGAFALAPLKRGSFVGEYCGDLLTQREADRRGRVYDKIDSSYLFNADQRWVIDARQRGSKLRLANHASQPNCMARVLLVDGDHRVAIFAQADVKPGDELFYNYRYALDNAPDWAQEN